jgi:hypothetical protein
MPQGSRSSPRALDAVSPYVGRLILWALAGVCVPPREAGAACATEEGCRVFAFAFALLLELQLLSVLRGGRLQRRRAPLPRRR